MAVAPLAGEFGDVARVGEAGGEVVPRTVSLNVLNPEFTPAAAESIATPGGVQFGPDGDAFLTNASRATPIPGTLDVAVHGSPLDVQIGENVVNHRVLAQLIENSPEIGGQPVRLLSCETGCLPEGFAQNLANKLGVPVSAPNDIIWAWPNGELSIGPDEFTNSGSFVTFVPGGNR